MKKYLFIPAGLLMFACGGESTVTSGTEVNSGNDSSIVEYRIDTMRITAVAFNDELTLMQNDMLNIMDILFQSDSADVEINHENALFEAKVNLSELDRMKFDGSEKPFVAEMKNLMSFYITELEVEFKKLIPLLQKSELSKQEDNRLNDYHKRFASDEKAIFMDVIAAQDKFAEANKIVLTEQ